MSLETDDTFLCWDGSAGLGAGLTPGNRQPAMLQFVESNAETVAPPPGNWVFEAVGKKPVGIVVGAGSAARKPPGVKTSERKSAVATVTAYGTLPQEVSSYSVKSGDAYRTLLQGLLDVLESLSEPSAVTVWVSSDSVVDQVNYGLARQADAGFKVVDSSGTTKPTLYDDLWRQVWAQMQVHSIRALKTGSRSSGLWTVAAKVKARERVVEKLSRARTSAGSHGSRKKRRGKDLTSEQRLYYRFRSDHGLLEDYDFSEAELLEVASVADSTDLYRVPS